VEDSVLQSVVSLVYGYFQNSLKLMDLVAAFCSGQMGEEKKNFFCLTIEVTVQITNLPGMADLSIKLS